MSKKIILIFGILVIIGIGLFLVFGSKPGTSDGGRIGFSLREFFPFGNSPDTDLDTQGEGDTPPINDGDFPITRAGSQVPRLRKISREPIAGSVIFNIGTTSIVRFIEKGTGNVYEATSLDTNIQRLTNTTIPKIIRAFWLPDGSGFLAQTLLSETEIVETSFVRLVPNTATTSNEILTPFKTVLSKLPTDIKEISIRPDGVKIFYYIINGQTSSWFIGNPDGTEANLVNGHSLTEWLPEWINQNTIMMQTKSSAETIGYLYTFNTSNKVLKKVGFGVTGLSTKTNGEGALTLISNGGVDPKLKVLDNADLSQISLSAYGLADKCIWLKEASPSVYCAIPNQLPSGDYPDDWYQGVMETEDSIRKIDVKNDVYYTLSDLSQESKESIDAIDLSLPKDESHLIFKNKRDGYLWLLRVED